MFTVKKNSPSVQVPFIKSLRIDTSGEHSRSESTATGISNEEEELFGRYIAASMRKLSERSKSLAKMRIQEILFQIEEMDRRKKERFLNLKDEIL